MKEPDEADVSSVTYSPTGAPQQGLSRMWETTAKARDTTIMELVEISESLRRARRPDLGKAFTSFGYILLGASAGAAVAGQKLSNKWVMVAGIVGLVCIFAGLVLWTARAETIASIHQRLEIHLRSVQDQHAVARMRAICKESDDRFFARIKRGLERRTRKRTGSA